MKRINKWYLAFICMLFLNACSDDKGDSMSPETEREKVKLAVILPQDQNGTDWNRVLNWVKQNIQQSNRRIEPEYEFYDENTVDLETVAKELANREDIAAVIGCFHSANTKIVASKCARSYKPMFTFSTSEELQRAFGQRGFLWCLAESDITQSELLLAKAERYQMKRVSLLASNDIYGKTFQDWFAFQAVELGLKPVGVASFLPEDLPDKFRSVAIEGVDCLICAPSTVKEACRIVELYRESGFKGRLLFSDIAYSSELIKTLGGKSNGIEGIADVSDPTTGFDVSYQAKFGEKPLLGESAVYDAVMVACYASLYATVQGVEINEAIATLLSLEPEGKGMWTTGSMSRVFESIERGETPAFSGASGNLDFSTDHYTSVLYSSYAHWMAYEGRFIHLDYDNRSESHTSSAYAAWEWNKQFSQQFEDTEPGLAYPSLEGHWGVIVAASKGWINYRHQADALAFYQLLKRKGYDDDHIILIMADDLAKHVNNPEPGVIRRVPDGENLYRNVQVDHLLSALSPEQLSDILLGKGPGTLGSETGDNVLFFWSGHGSKGEWMWGEDDAVTAELVSETFRKMASEKKFRKMLCLIETCYSGSVAEKCVGIPGLLMITAANGNETSKADRFNNDLGVWMTNRFTSVLLDRIGKNPEIPLRDLYTSLFQQTLGSHVSVYNADFYGSVYRNSLREYMAFP